jgi:RNA-directed DNA polymerase
VPTLSEEAEGNIADGVISASRRRTPRGQRTFACRESPDDFVAGFEHEVDAQRVLVDIRERFAKFGLELHPDKTRLIEFGRHAARTRAARGVGKPQTFDFTHMCGKTRTGRFWVTRKTISKRMRAKLAEVKDQCLRRRHQPIPLQGQWLASVVRGHLAYYAVPGNTEAVAAFRNQATRHWFRALRRRSQRTRLTWKRMYRLATRWLPPARVLRPFRRVRFDARTQGRSPVR